MSDETLRYYDEHAEDYAGATLDLDLSDLHARFLALVPPGGHVLDAGCGPGRDARLFKDRGYRVTAYDASPRMAGLAARRLGQPVSTQRFQEFHGRAEFDGVWASAAFLHVPREELVEVLTRHLRCLRPGGVLYMSFKHGSGELHSGGRHFLLMTAAGLRAILDGLEGAELVTLWTERDRRPEFPHQRWLNALVRWLGEPP